MGNILYNTRNLLLNNTHTHTPETVHGTTIQALSLLHSVHVVLLVDVHTHDCATPGGILQGQLSANAMAGAGYL